MNPLILHTLRALEGSGVEDIGKYDNRRLDNRVDWSVDNFSKCKEHYNSLGNTSWHTECVTFINGEYDSQKFNRDWDEKHGKDYLDEVNKDRYERMMDRINEYD